MGYISATLKPIGIEEKYITLDASKLIKIKAKHHAMTDEMIKEVPKIIEDPLLIVKSRQSASRIVLLGELTDAEGKSVVTVLELHPANRNGLLLEEIKVVSTYGKDNVQNFINNSQIMYMSAYKKRTSNWLASTGLQLPVEQAVTDSIDSIAQKLGNTTKKYSIDVDDVLFMTQEQGYSAQAQEIASIVVSAHEVRYFPPHSRDLD